MCLNEPESSSNAVFLHSLWQYVKTILFFPCTNLTISNMNLSGFSKNANFSLTYKVFPPKLPYPKGFFTTNP